MFGSRENDLLKRALALYAGDHVLEHVLRHGERALTIGGTTRDMTVMFIDVAAYAEIRDGLTHDDLNALMLSWFEVLTTGIVDHGGTLDTYIGDAMSAWWGGGLGTRDELIDERALAQREREEVRSAVDCARRLVTEMSNLNETFRRKGWPELKLGIGIATGPVRFGVYGSSKRLRYSMLGDTVNLASQLCALADRSYPHAVLITESTQVLLGDSTISEPVDTVRVKGRDDPVRLYTV